jgi:ribosomal small subunit protein bTHX
MGKGDIKTRRGKLFNGSFGKRRPRRKPMHAMSGTFRKKTIEKKG